jgi:hypothetical protein
VPWWCTAPATRISSPKYVGYSSARRSWRVGVSTLWLYSEKVCSAETRETSTCGSCARLWHSPTECELYISPFCNKHIDIYNTASHLLQYLHCQHKVFHRQDSKVRMSRKFTPYIIKKYSGCQQLGSRQTWPIIRATSPTHYMKENKENKEISSMYNSIITAF